VFSKLCLLYLPLRNTVVHLVNSAARFCHYASGQTLSRPSTLVSPGPPGNPIPSTTTQSKQRTALPANAVPNLQRKTSNVSVSAQNTTTQQVPTGSRNDYILLCSDERRWLTTWEDLNVTETKSDRELFEQFHTRLNRRKRWIRRCVSLKTIQRISFVKVSEYSCLHYNIYNGKDLNLTRT
jgi:hypothetical protein